MNFLASLSLVTGYVAGRAGNGYKPPDMSVLGYAAPTQSSKGHGGWVCVSHGRSWRKCARYVKWLHVVKRICFHTDSVLSSVRDLEGRAF